MRRQDNRSPERRWRDRFHRFLGGVFTITVHAVVLAALLWPRAAPPPPRAKPEHAPLMITFVNLPEPKPPGSPNPLEAETRRENAAHLARLHLPAPVVVVALTPAADPSETLSASQLAGAASASEEGTGGGGCDTARAVQQALRRDPLVRQAVEEAGRLDKASMLWNGDWVRLGGQDGKGLSAVREAVMWEVAFLPEACRNQRMHGLVLVSLADGATRFAIGANDWRWSDLLGARGPRQALNR